MLLKLDPSNPVDAALLSFRPAFVSAAGFSLVANLLMLVPTFYMLQLYDRVLTSRNSSTLLMLTLLLLVLLALHKRGGGSSWQHIATRGASGWTRRLGRKCSRPCSGKNLQMPDSNAVQAMQDLTHLRQFLGGAGVTLFSKSRGHPSI